MKRVRVLLADDHRLVAEGLSRLLEDEFELVATVEDGQRLIEEAERVCPDVAVVDLTMPRINGLDAIPLLKKAAPKIKVVVITMHREAAYARRAFSAGADGFVLKHAAADELIRAIRDAVDGRSASAANRGETPSRDDGATAPGSPLTERQREIVQLFVKGLSAKQIASVLGLSVRTVEFHKYRAMEAVGAANGADLIRYAIEHAIAEP